MYIPEFNRVEDCATALAFMRANPFAILVSNAEGGPFATHLPVLIDDVNSEIRLRAHVAKSNPHWQMIEGESESLVIFHGPHAYISPSLYEIRESVPTWNYATVHVYGKGIVVTDDAQTRQILEDLITQFDASYLLQWKALNEEYRRCMQRHIVAFEIAATRIETKFKLSQNRTTVEQENVIQMLLGHPDSAVRGTATLMREHGLGRGPEEGA